MEAVAKFIKQQGRVSISDLNKFVTQWSRRAFIWLLDLLVRRNNFGLNIICQYSSLSYSPRVLMIEGLKWVIPVDTVSDCLQFVTFQFLFSFSRQLDIWVAVCQAASLRRSSQSVLVAGTEQFLPTFPQISSEMWEVRIILIFWLWEITGRENIRLGQVEVS